MHLFTQNLLFSIKTEGMSNCITTFNKKISPILSQETEHIPTAVTRFRVTQSGPAWFLISWDPTHRCWYFLVYLLLLSSGVDKSFRRPDCVGWWMEQTALPGCLRFSPKWIGSEQHQQLRRILVGKVCRSQSTNLSSLSHLAAFIDQYVFSPRHQSMEGWEGHPTPGGWRTNQEVALSPVSLCKHLCKGELAHCQERVSMHDFHACLEYVLESAEENVGFVSPCVGSWLVSHFNLRGPFRKMRAVL